MAQSLAEREHATRCNDQCNERDDESPAIRCEESPEPGKVNQFGFRRRNGRSHNDLIIALPLDLARNH